MRHANPQMTIGTYAKAVTADKRNAQNAVMALFLIEPDREEAA
jgi:hypothetical protein